MPRGHSGAVAVSQPPARGEAASAGLDEARRVRRSSRSIISVLILSPPGLPRSWTRRGTSEIYPAGPFPAPPGGLRSRHDAADPAHGRRDPAALAVSRDDEPVRLEVSDVHPYLRDTGAAGGPHP